MLSYIFVMQTFWQFKHPIHGQNWTEGKCKIGQKQIFYGYNFGSNFIILSILP